MMKHPALTYLVLSGTLFFSALPALAQLPKRDLTVELRQVDEGEDTTYAVSTQTRDARIASQQVRVRNGEKASLSVGKSMAMQWVQSVGTENASQAKRGGSSGGGVTYAVTWMDAGQRLQVQPRWPGAKQLVSVDIEVQSASVQARTGAELPDQLRSRIATTVSAPLGQWVTIASTGSRSQRGAYDSETTSDNTRRLLQIRVLAP